MNHSAQLRNPTPGISHEDDQARLALGWSLGLALDEIDGMSHSGLMRLAAQRIERDAKIAQHVSSLAKAARAAGFDGTSGPAMMTFIQERLATGAAGGDIAQAWSVAAAAFEKLRLDLEQNAPARSLPPMNEAASWSNLLQEASGRIKAQQTTIELLVTGAIKPDPSQKLGPIKP